jgi:hypothetical protein
MRCSVTFASSVGAHDRAYVIITAEVENDLFQAVLDPRRVGFGMWLARRTTGRSTTIFLTMRAIGYISCRRVFPPKRGYGPAVARPLRRFQGISAGCEGISVLDKKDVGFHKCDTV